MERLFLECAMRVALLPAGTAAVLYLMRVKTAAARHSVWIGVLVLMLLLPIWVAWGPKASFRVLPPLPPMSATETIAPAAFSTTFSRPPLLSPWEGVLLGVYVLGLCLFLLRLAIGTIQAGRLVRDAIPRDGVLTSSVCAAPVTVGFFHPTVILPEHSRKWPPAQLDAILAHESAHARRHDPLTQWLALLNRAVFWFHPVAWWLERHVSALAEEACDNAVLARGHNPREYSEYLMDIARSVMRSGARLNIAGMSMPGSSLHRRIRKILEGSPMSEISTTRVAFTGVLCVITCAAFAAGTLDHVQQGSSMQPVMMQREAISGTQPATKFVLGDLKIEGDAHDGAGVRKRILQAWKNREYEDEKELAAEVVSGIRADFQKRGYFKVLIHDPVLQPLSLAGGEQRVLVIDSITEGAQFRLGAITIRNTDPSRPLSIAAATLLEQFHLRSGDLFNVTEIRAGLERLNRLYGDRRHTDVRAEPDTEVDTNSHLVQVVIRVTEGSVAGGPTSAAQGQIDVLSDTMGVDFGPYLKRVADDVRMHWFPLIPEEARAPQLIQGTVSVEFAIMKDGSISGLKIVSSSGDDALDRAASRGISASNPFPPLPTEFGGPLLALRFHFHYNPKNPSVFK